MSFLNYLVSGLSLGSVYAIIALGYTMVYGIAKMLNFAHGDVIMVGAYICFFAFTRYGLNPFLSVVLAMLVCTCLGIVIEKLAYKPLRAAPSLAVLITAIGVSYLLQNLALLFWSSNPKVFNPIIPNKSINLGGLTVSYITILTIVVCVAIMIVLTTFINKTKLGKAMRAVSEDKGAAQLMGIDVNTTISVTFAIGHRFHAWHQGLYGCRIRRHRLHPRRIPGRAASWDHREPGESVHLHADLRRHRVRRVDHRAAR